MPTHVLYSEGRQGKQRGKKRKGSGSKQGGYDKNGKGIFSVLAITHLLHVIMLFPSSL